MNKIGGCLGCGETVNSPGPFRDGAYYVCPDCGEPTWMTVDTLVDIVNQYTRAEEEEHTAEMEDLDEIYNDPSYW